MLNPDLTFYHALIRKEGIQLGEFRTPVRTAMDDKGMLYIDDKCNHRVQKFSPYDEFIAQLARKEQEKGS